MGYRVSYIFRRSATQECIPLTKRIDNRGVDRLSDALSDVKMANNMIWLVLHHQRKATCLIYMCLVRLAGVHVRLMDISMAAALPSYMTVIFSVANLINLILIWRIKLFLWICCCYVARLYSAICNCCLRFDFLRNGTTCQHQVQTSMIAKCLCPILLDMR